MIRTEQTGISTEPDEGKREMLLRALGAGYPWACPVCANLYQDLYAAYECSAADVLESQSQIDEIGPVVEWVDDITPPEEQRTLDILNGLSCAADHELYGEAGRCPECRVEGPGGRVG